MHEQRIGLGHFHHLLVDAPIGKRFFAGFVLGLIAHAGPHIGGDQISAFTSLHRVFKELRAGSTSNAHNCRVNFVATRGAEVDFKAQQVGRL